MLNRGMPLGAFRANNYPQYPVEVLNRVALVFGMRSYNFRGGGTSVSSIFSSMRSIREVLGFMGSGSLPRSACSSH
jgi:hypothetical protein